MDSFSYLYDLKVAFRLDQESIITAFGFIDTPAKTNAAADTARLLGQSSRDAEIFLPIEIKFVGEQVGPEVE